MLEEFVDKILSLARSQEIMYNGVQYTTGKFSLFPKPYASQLRISTLAGLVSYIKENSKEMKDDIIVHVNDHTSVSVRSALDSVRGRETLIHADMSLYKSEFVFNSHHNVETFIIGLQSQFVESETRNEILKLVSSLTTDRSTTATDDGISQTVVARKGVALQQKVSLPNPVLLRPYRTFREVQQPESRFILRVKQSTREDELPGIALFEADGSQWKLEAIKNIRDYLTKELAFSEEEKPNITISIIA